MKKLLLGTTALVGASFMATAAFAAPEIKLGGFMDFQVGMTSQDIDNFGPSPGGFANTPNDRGYGFINDSEIIIKVSDTLDNGLSWSVKIELEAGADDSNDNADEVTLTLSGAWGSLFVGNDDGPTDTMKIGGKTAVKDAGTGGIGGNFRRFVGWNTVNAQLHDNDMDVTDSGDSTKIAYVTPRIAGLQAAVSFTPNSSDTSQDRFSDGASFSIDEDLVTSAQENYFEMGLGYDQKFDQFRVRAAAVYSSATAQNQTDSAGYSDVSAYGFGAAVGFGSFTVSAGYANDGKSNMSRTQTNNKVSSMGVGLGYNMGAWDFGLSYYEATAGANSRTYSASALTGDDTLSVLSAGATYELGTGLTIYTEATWFDTKASSTATITQSQTEGNNSGMTLISGISVEF